MVNNYKRVHIDKEEGAAPETIGKEEAMWFPVMAGAVLCGLYFLIKTFGKEVVNPLLLCYMGVGGAMSIKGILTLLPQLKALDDKKLFRLKSKWLELDHEVTPCDFVALALSYSIVGLYLVTKNWLINNIVATFFCLHALEMMFLGSFKVGFLMLSLLFFYDIFFVFGTDVMLTVAKSIDAPIKLLFPKDWSTEPPQFSLLGLGDIVLPGIFISMCLRFDVVRSFADKAEQDPQKAYARLIKCASSASQRYFKGAMAGYLIGILMTVAVMIIFDHGQPALLYLVPCCLLSVVITAVKNNETAAVMAFEEADLYKPND